MTMKEYLQLFHRAQVNLVAFKPIFHCDEELRHMVEMAVEEEREACASLCSAVAAGRDAEAIEEAIRARGENT